MRQREERMFLKVAIAMRIEYNQCYILFFEEKNREPKASHSGSKAQELLPFFFAYVEFARIRCC